MHRTTAIFALATALLIPVTPASAGEGDDCCGGVGQDPNPKVVEVAATGQSGDASVSATCSFVATYPSTQLDTTHFAVRATATTTSRGSAPVTTSVDCYPVGLTTSGGAGITLPGSRAEAFGTAQMDRVATDVQLCIVASSSLQDGTVVSSVESCRPLS